MRRTVFTPRGKTVLVISIVLGTVWTLSAWALEGPAGRTTPKGLGAVHAIVETTLPDGQERFAAVYSALQQDVEARLRRAHIPVDAAATERLLVVVDIFGVEDRLGCLATVDVGLHPSADAPPVRTHREVRASCAKIDQQARKDTRDLVDEFITAYLEQNPQA